MEDFFNGDIFSSYISFEDAVKSAEEYTQDSRIKKKLTKEKIKEQLDKFSEKARRIIDNPEKVSAVLEKAVSVCDDLGKIRIIGKHFREISLICNMINDYICRRYTKVPTATVITLLAAVLYFISPIDIIPDFLPVIGRMDDMVVFAFVRDAFSTDLKKYEKWKTQQPEDPDLISEG